MCPHFLRDCAPNTRQVLSFEIAKDFLTASPCNSVRTEFGTTLVPGRSSSPNSDIPYPLVQRNLAAREHAAAAAEQLAPIIEEVGFGEKQSAAAMQDAAG